MNGDRISPADEFELWHTANRGYTSIGRGLLMLVNSKSYFQPQTIYICAEDLQYHFGAAPTLLMMVQAVVNRYYPESMYVLLMVGKDGTPVLTVREVSCEPEPARPPRASLCAA